MKYAKFDDEEIFMTMGKSDVSPKILTRFLKYLFLFLLILCTGVTITFYSIRKKNINDLNSREQQLLTYVNSASVIESINSDVLYLASHFTHFDKEYSKTEDRLRELGHDFMDFSKSKLIYDQIRYIDAAGNEQIRVNLKDGVPFLVPKEQLQNKAGRYYFTESYKLKKDEIYISPLDLNIEGGEIEQPLKPMIRVGTPVFNGNLEKAGIIIVNFKAKEILNNIRKIGKKSNGKFYLINKDGYYFIGDSTGMEWSFMYKDRKSSNLIEQFPPIWSKINEGGNSKYIRNYGLVNSTKIYPFQAHKYFLSDIEGKNFVDDNMSNQSLEEYSWIAVSYISNTEINKRVLAIDFFWIIAFVIISLGILLLLYTLASIKEHKIKSDEKIKEQTLELEESEALLRETNKHLELREKHFRLLTENVSDVIWVLNISQKRFTYFSSSVYQVTGYTPDEALNLSIKSILTPDFYYSVIRKVSKRTSKFIKKRNADKFYMDEMQQYKKNGEIIWIEISTRFRYTSNNEIEILGVARNIDSRKAMEKTLRSREVELMKLNNTKNKFFSIIAHDLKSPFSGLLNISELLLTEFKNANTSKLESIIRNMYESTNSTYKLLINLLTWANSQSGKIIYTPAKIRIEELAMEACDAVQNLADEKGINLIKNIPPPLQAMIDKNTIVTVIRNLISNAIKFTPKGGMIIISASLKKSDIPYVEVNIEDTGVGIPEEKISNIFQIEQKNSTVGTEGERGTGLGLLLCREFVENNGGQIWVKSTVGKGSNFTFSLPISS